MAAVRALGLLFVLVLVFTCMRTVEAKERKINSSKENETISYRGKSKSAAASIPGPSNELIPLGLGPIGAYNTSHEIKYMGRKQKYTTGHIGYKAYPLGKYWTRSQCTWVTETLTGYSLEACLSDCTSNGECNAAVHSPSYQYCYFMKCPYPTPEPAGRAPTFTGYARSGYTSQRPGYYWTSPSPCQTGETTVKDSLDACKHGCTNNGNCNAFTYAGEYETCTYMTCPIPPPVPTQYFAGLVAFSEKAGCLFGAQQYRDGETILNMEVCAQLKCDGDTGKFTFLAYDDGCSSCMGYWDPHILTYDQSSGGGCDWEDPNMSSTSAAYCGSFAYQKCGKFSLSQSDSTYDPTYAVYATFVQCGGSSSATCVGTVYLKNDANTIVAVVYENYELKIQVNNMDVDDGSLSTSPSQLQVSQTVYPVLAWTSTYVNAGKTTICVNLQGSSGFMVRYCGDPYNYANTVVVLAHPDIVKDGLVGLCGNANNNVFDDLKNRAGNNIPIWERESMTRWKASVFGGDGACPSTRMNSLNNCELDPSARDGFVSQCETSLKSAFSSEEKILNRILLDDCVYDLCNVTDTTKWMQSIQATVQVRADFQNNTKESVIIPKANATIANATIAPTSEAPTTVADTTTAPTSEALTNVADTIIAPTSEAPTTAPTEVPENNHEEVVEERKAKTSRGLFINIIQRVQ